MIKLSFVLLIRTVSFVVAASELLLRISLSAGAEVKPTRQTEWEKTLALAKEEGQITVYMSGYSDVLPMFQKAFPGIKMVSVTGRGGQIQERIFAERRAGKFLADIFAVGTTSAFLFHQAKGFDPIRPALILPEVRDESKWWQGKHQYLDSDKKYIFAYAGNVGLVFSYNTNLVDPNEFNSYWDFLNPKWKGKILVRDISEPGPGTDPARFIYYNPEIGPKFLRRLFTEMNVTVVREYRQQIDWLAVGKFPICIFCSTSDVAKAREQGLPVDNVPPHTLKEGNPVVVTFGNLGLVNRAPHPNAAKVFINWLLSRNGQISVQHAINTGGRTMESLREDIPKDSVAAEYRRRKGIRYLITGTPETSEMTPIIAVMKESLAAAEKGKSSR